MYQIVYKCKETGTEEIISEGENFQEMSLRLAAASSVMGLYLGDIFKIPDAPKRVPAYGLNLRSKP